MAGLIGLTAADIVIQDALGAVRWKYEGEWIPHPVVRLTTTLPVAVNEEEGRTVVRARWGFPLGGGRPVGNARDDKLRESRLWSSLLGKTPCLLASTGIYEMVREKEAKQSYWFRRVDRQPIIMPGLAGVRNIKGEKQLCAVIVTTEPNGLFSKFHNRQVCTVTAGEADQWMASADVDQLMSILHPPADDEWEAVPVDNRIFAKGRIEAEDLVETGPPQRHDD